jgi:hypothetical protein
MARSRSTVDVLWLLEDTNRILALPTVQADVKRGVALLLERVLFQTGNYAGFLYLSDRQKDGDWTPEENAARVYLYSRRLKRQADRMAAKV